MRQKDLEHISGYISGKDLGLSWLHAIACLRTVAAVLTHPHAHHQDELLFCLRGEFYYHIDGIGEATLTTGMGMLIPADVQHAFRNDIDAPGERISLFLKRRESQNARFTVFTPSDYRLLHSRLLAAAGHPFQIPRSQTEYIRKLSEFARQNEPSMESVKRAQTRVMASSVFLGVAMGSGNEPRAPQFIESATKYLEEHLGEDIDIQTLVEHIGYSRARFFDLFRERYRMSPMQYLTRLRMEKARELLSTTDWSVKEIARRVGIANAVYFSALFRHNCAMTPMEWRNKANPITLK